LKTIFTVYFFLLVLPSFLFCTTPEWAIDAIWYQIFPERFFNGDPANDPDLESLKGTWPYDEQTWWEITSWTSDWYEMQPWEKANGFDYRYQFQWRRYGGDIQGIIDKLDYLEELGVNAIYLNPIFESPSSHKYGARFYHHIDNNFGPDPKGDEEIWSEENPSNPDSWQWTSADLLFLELIKKVHDRGMHIIIDGVFNHVGIPFWALQDVFEKGKTSIYANWFTITKWDDRATEENEIDYEGWSGIKDLPVLTENENGLIEPIQNHIHAIVKRWMDPNNDGDPSDGIDGWRLDVAEQVNIKFWKKFRRWAEDINPNVFLTGEVWWEDYWNNKMLNAAPWLKGDAFHSVMNYRFGDAMFKFFIDDKQKISSEKLDKLLAEIRFDYPQKTAFVLQNCLDSHDTERLASAVVNPERWIDHGNNTWYNPEFNIRKPNKQERQIQKAILTFQFTYIGTPFIYYGDEAGMWGADDPDCRKPMVWKEFNHDMEKAHPCDHQENCFYSRKPDDVYFDKEMFSYYQSLISLRKKYPALRRGICKTVYKKKSVFAFERSYKSETVLAVFNSSISRVKIPSSLFGDNQKNWRIIHGKGNSEQIEGKTGKVFVRVN
jgi:glycosidase